MVARLIDAMGTADAGIAVTVVAGLLIGFVVWVVLNEGRTRRLERLIRAFRGPGEGGDDDV